MSVKRILSISIISLAASMVPLAANATDFFSPTSAYSWSGFYIGVHTGFGGGHSSLRNDTNNADVEPVGEGLDWIRDNCLHMSQAAIDDLATNAGIWNSADNLGDWCGPPLDQSGSPGGVIGGMQAGYNMHSGDWVFGVLGDLSLANISGVMETNIDRGPFYAKFQTTYNWLATMRARAGMLVTEQTLAYVHGGLALANITVENLNSNANGSLGDVHYNGVAFGGVAGFGVEHKVTDNLSLVAEYSFLGFAPSQGSYRFDPWDDFEGEEDIGTQDEYNTGTFTMSNLLHLFKLGANWSF